jgi:outer membrane protein
MQILFSGFKKNKSVIFNMKSYAFTIVGFLLLMSFFAEGQTKGRYIPTKYDNVKKVVPQQVYGNPIAQRRADSIANAVKQAKELEQRRIEDEAAEKRRIEELQRNELKNKKKLVEKQQQPINKIKEPSTKVQKTPKVKKEYTLPVVESPVDKNIEAKKKINGPWQLQDCIEYAHSHNLKIKESELNERMAQLILEQNKASRLPNLNGDVNLGQSFGRGLDPTTNQFVDNKFLFSTMGLSSQTLLFGWFQKQHEIERNQFEIEAITSANNQLKDNISLNVATGYLRVLMAREQVKISEEQLEKDYQQFLQASNTFRNNKNADYNSVQLSAQLSADSALVLSQKSDERIAMLQLRALMNFNFEENFDIQSGSMNMNQIANINSLLTPDAMFSYAREHQYQMKYHESKLMSAKKTLDIAKAKQYPQLTFFSNLGTTYSSNVKDITSQNYEGQTSIGNVDIAGTSYPITESSYSYTTRTRPFINQFGNHIRLNAGLSLNVPIFNAYATKTSLQKAQIGLVSQQLSLDNESQQLKQNIYTAYEQVKAASLKYNASSRVINASQKAMDMVTRKRENGEISTYEYIAALNALYQANTSALNAKYDLLFKLKVLDYYMGNSLKL